MDNIINMVDDSTREGIEAYIKTRDTILAIKSKEGLTACMLTLIDEWCRDNDEDPIQITSVMAQASSVLNTVCPLNK